MRAYGRKMIQIAAMLLALVMMVSVAGVQGVEAKAKKKNVVILYFSATGTTKEVAARIRKATNTAKTNLVRIKAKNPYTEEDLDYTDDNSRVTKEHESAKTPAKSKVRPKISNLTAIKRAVKKADIVYIGYPIWWGEAPHIIYTLVESVSLKGKTVVPFSTSISSGLGSSAKHLKARAIISSKTKWLKGRNFYGVPSQKTVNNWVKKIK